MHAGAGIDATRGARSLIHGFVAAPAPLAVLGALVAPTCARAQTSAPLALPVLPNRGGRVRVVLAPGSAALVTLPARRARP